MGNDQELAEERLLRLIEEDTTREQSAQLPHKSAIKRMRFFQGPKNIKRSDREDSLLKNLKLMTFLMWLVLLGLSTYVVWEVFLAEEKLSQPVLASHEYAIPDATDMEIPTLDLSQLEMPLADFVAAVTDRNPFGLSRETEPSIELPKQPVKTAHQRLLDKAKELNVVGIDYGDYPQAIIEDLSQRRTHFLEVGDDVNGLTIVEISSRGVVVSYEGEDLLLK